MGTAILTWLNAQLLKQAYMRKAEGGYDAQVDDA